MNTYEDLSKDELKLLLAYNRIAAKTTDDKKAKDIRQRKIECIRKLLDK